MKDTVDEILGYKTIYFSWSDGLGYPDDPVKFTLALARQTGLSITVVCKSLNSVPDELGKADYVTERSRRVSGRPTITLLFYPTRKNLERPLSTSARHVVAAEWPELPLEWWAAKRGAWDIRAGSPMSLELDPEVQKLYERILWNGNNGWHDKPGRRDALRDLLKLRDLDALDKEQLVGYFLGVKNSSAIGELEKLADRAMTSRG